MADFKTTEGDAREFFAYSKACRTAWGCPEDAKPGEAEYEAALRRYIAGSAPLDESAADEDSPKLLDSGGHGRLCVLSDSTGQL